MRLVGSYGSVKKPSSKLGFDAAAVALDDDLLATCVESAFGGNLEIRGEVVQTIGYFERL